MLRSALIYASWGWHVHPMRPGDKRPLLANWPQRATTDFDASSDHLNVANGVLELRIGDLVPHEPGQRFTYRLQVAYEPGTNYAPPDTSGHFHSESTVV